MASNNDVVKKNYTITCLYYVSISVSVCLLQHRPLYQNQIFKTPITFYNPRCRCSVLLWPHCNTSCTSGTSGFVDDVMFLRNDNVTKTPSPCHSIR